MDFVHDQLVTGRKLRVLTVVDTFSRFSPVVDPRFNYKGEDVVRTLEQACKLFGYPKSIRAELWGSGIDPVDQFPEGRSGIYLSWSRSVGVSKWCYYWLLTTRKTNWVSWEAANAFIESFNGKFRAECLNAHWFMSLDDARDKLESWRRDYNEFRPHSAIGNIPPIELVNRMAASSPP